MYNVTRTPNKLHIFIARTKLQAGTYIVHTSSCSTVIGKYIIRHLFFKESWYEGEKNNNILCVILKQNGKFFILAVLSRQGNTRH